jgi:hypothetical protein
MTCLINKAAVKKYLIERSKQLRPGHPFTRVSAESLVELDSLLRSICDSAIRRQPACGTTIRF